MAKDQQVLSYLLSGFSNEICGHVNTKVTAASAWATIEGLFVAKSRARIIATRMALANTSRGTSTIAEYFGKMKSLAEELASVGKKLDDEELVSYILAGLDEPFDSVVSGVALRVEPITVGVLFTQLVSDEQQLDLRTGGSNSSVNLASRGSHGGGNQHQPRGLRGHGG
jgi:hypothetical protein